MSTPHVRRVLQDMAASMRSIGEAIALPPAAYTSDEFFEFERRTIFDRSWLYLCHESEVAAPGQALQVTVIDEPLLVTRSEDGQIHVLSAVCQHRGHTLCGEHVTARHVRCPYHYWTYALDGRLVAAPSMTPDFELKQLKRNIRLPELRVEVWHGMVFANFDDDAPPLAPSLHRLEDVLRTHRIEDLSPAHTAELEHLPYNWKNMLENALEEYHTAYVHRGYHENAPANLVRHGIYERGDGAIYRHAGLVIKGGEDVPGRPTFPVIDGLRESDRGFLIFFAVPPSLFAVAYPHGVKTFRVLPVSAGEIAMRISFLFPASTIAGADFPAKLERQVELIELIDQPDVESNSRVFQGMKSRFAPRGPLGPQETTLPQLYQWLLDRCEGALAEGIDARLVSS
jgi:phenylpropionate dioxygenase-like ring-hydroxylating dioxygenase large terminal subunit